MYPRNKGATVARNKYPEETVKLIIDEAQKLFMQKGYEDTSIQDIIDHLGGLSKGAIYHHFKSKEEIFEAVCQKIGEDNAVFYDRIRDDKTQNGREKLRTMFSSACTNPSNDVVRALTAKILSDPKFLTNQIEEIYTVVAPQYVQPMIEEGIRDGSIKTEYPKELAEVIITLGNIWINPIIAYSDAEGIRGKVEFFSMLLKKLDLDIFDQELIEQYVQYFGHYKT